jgi:methyl-accepting chemotaxis protein
MTYIARVPPPWTRLSTVAALFLSFGICCVAQDTAPRTILHPPANSDETAWEVQQRKEMAKKVNLQRQEEIKKDTEKLLELATELKQSVDKTTADTLSLEVIKKADQIEKLAKSVKEKMKGP